MRTFWPEVAGGGGALDYTSPFLFAYFSLKLAAKSNSQVFHKAARTGKLMRKDDSSSWEEK